MFKVKGKVLTVEDGMMAIHDRDANKNKLPTTTDHRITNIMMLVKDGQRSIPILVKGYDLPSSFVCPKEGEDWESPSIKAYDSRFKHVPEVSI